MTDPIQFQSTSPRFNLPLLFAGQAQKEFVVNEALSLADAMLHCNVQGSASAPPSSPEDGENWLVEAQAMDEWAGQDGNIACRQSGNWIFVAPRDGMQLFDLSTSQIAVSIGQVWQKCSTQTAPVGGTTIDENAREALANLISELRSVGILP